MAIQRIVILGAGTMGANIALDLAAHGFEVCLSDPKTAQLDKAKTLAQANAALLQQHGLLKDAVAEVLARIAFVPALDEALIRAEMVLEAVPEDLALKQRVFEDLERRCGNEVILASNTSTFMPSKLAEGRRHPERLLVVHYWNPAHLLPLVELVPHAGTSPAIVENVRALLLACGKRPIQLKKEVPGFIGNRLAFALQREAMDLVAQGVATPDDIDAVASASFGRRIPVTGIFGTADLGGLDVYAAICDSIFPSLCADQGAPEALKAQLAQGRKGVKSGAGWRDYTPAEIDALRAALSNALIAYAQRDRETQR